VCGCGKLVPILALGGQYVSNFVDSPAQDGENVPLTLVLCDAVEGGCGLLQLLYTTPADWMYRNYWYKSGVNKSMQDALADIAAKAQALTKLSSSDIVIDIGCNDGTLLRAFTAKGLITVGFEPAKNLVGDASKGTSCIINDFFNFASFNSRFHGKKAKVISAIAMFYDLDDPNTFVSDVEKCLSPDGVFIIQMSYLPLMLSTNNFDNICHEHLEYYSLGSLSNLLQRHGLEIFDAELNDVNGGSIRAYVRHRGSKLQGFQGSQKRIDDLKNGEKNLMLETLAPYEEFAKRVEEEKNKLVEFVKSEVSKGKTVYVYGASTKGNTLLQYYGLDNRWIKAAAERNPDKWGKMTVGTHILIISEKEARDQRPDYFLVLPWHFRNEFVQREAQFLQLGSKFIFPLPTFEVVGKAD
jgi:SAM-dependent methyltransferase